MKIFLVLLITMALSGESMHLQEDKQKHFAGSMAIGGVATGIARHYGSNKIESFFIGVAISLLVGIAKEKLDDNGHGVEDINDVYAGTLGGISGSIISSQLNWSF